MAKGGVRYNMENLVSRMPAEVTQVATPDPHFGPIVKEFGFLWRAFAFVEEGRVTAGLEKLGPDPHLDLWYGF